MGANSHIEWCDHTFNPWEGCTKVSPGCTHCYAAARDQRFTRGAHWGKGAPRRRTSVHNWNEPRRWNKTAGESSQLFGNIPWARQALDQATHRPRVFCASLADWLDDEVPIEWLTDLLDLIRTTPHLDWLLLTKRPENFRPRLKAAADYVRNRDRNSLVFSALADGIESWVSGFYIPANVWIGTTVEDQPRLDERIARLRAIPAKVRFLSVEPMLGPINLFTAATIGSKANAADLRCPGDAWVDWVICGGESGAGARPFVVEWAWEIYHQCKAAGVPFFMKQLGANPIAANVNALDWPEETIFRDDLLDPQWAAGAAVETKHSKGGDIAEFPSELKVREFPGNEKAQPLRAAEAEDSTKGKS